MAKAGEIAAWLGVELEPGADVGVELLAVSSIEAAEISSIVFATDGKNLAVAVDSAAGLILAGHRAAEGVGDLRVLRVADARLAFAKVAQRLGASKRVTEIHATAVVDATVTLGEGTRVGAGSVLEEGVTIGRDCEIGPRVVIYAGTRLGDRVNVQAGAVLGGKGFGYARDSATGEYTLFPQQGTLVIEDDVDIGANTTIDRGALGETRIGAGSKLDNLVHIGHNCVIGRNVVIAAQTGISGSSVVEDGAILGGQVGIGEHALVGKGVILGGGAGVLSNKKMQGPGQVFWGRPARPLKEYLRDLASLKKR
ncbi:UDP-3-O-[3-hydroxymyristoyl] glucosamine N-acyltransferase [Granulicella aggregans]|uniref:UDP-3-O-[3-hydroxymyristoyl] glucosamine N-acyltransferase n=1 Tax=Granulicella aggregans TaxID=474949 RepID=A0A7W7ZCV8_9BACT|nr:UDP-3-O-(3-hydroxymyristoyl)glucosamine N-acyltransferase [Granulicella aggregans]MBB5057591.1 UDP-3-O-[3-hydroxymyristoyl] glucosamine N-acyltransferase [Granulicella aggregans]